MPRVPPEIKRILAVLDAEADAKLVQLQLPFWVALYRLPKPGGERRELLFRRGRHLEAAQRGILPTTGGRPPAVSAIISNAEMADPAARYLLRMLMLKKRENQADGVKALRYLLAHPPSSHPAAKHLAEGKKKADTMREAEWARWQQQAGLIWKAHPSWLKSRVAERVKQNLKLADAARTIRRRIKK